MSRPRIYEGLTLDNVLARMVPGRTYAAHVIAAKFHTSTKDMRPLLDKLVASGDVELSHAQPKTLGFRRPRAAEADVKPVVVETGIATPPVLVRLSGELKGYDGEIARRMALCMLVRGVR
ncbi:hypothetical protein [Paraburkholderia saeva]|uniref:hypothetical protein n=1 Tax=Paraburkholderia saeva TaxID=2777537 RepID=UPI001DA502F7|nr:hypothetical protein [Paraburkholderia saeva]CAG4887724.1 hypothetical protein R52603_00499 [Paraburkholderia saeva]